MADTHALESLAELLPPERRERFFTIASKFRNIREDDDHLQLLEAIGFLLLVMKEIPAEINAILEQAQRTIGEAESEKLRSEVVAVLTESLDTPSYKDLRGIVQTMRETYEKSRIENGKLLSGLGKMERAVSDSNHLLPSLAVGVSSAAVTLILGAITAYFFLPQLLEPQNLTLPDQLRPYGELHGHGRLEHFDQDLPNYADGEVRILMIKGDVIEAFKDGPNGVVVIRKAEGLPTPQSRAESSN